MTHKDNDLNYLSSNKSNNSSFYYSHTNNVTYVEDIGYRGTALRLNQWYILFYVTISKLLLVEIIPWITVIILNFCIWRKLQTFRETRRIALGKETGKYWLHIFLYKINLFDLECKVTNKLHNYMGKLIYVYRQWKSWSEDSDVDLLSFCCMSKLSNSGRCLWGSKLHPSKRKIFNVYFKWPHREYNWHCSFYALIQCIHQLFTLCHAREDFPKRLPKGKLKFYW